MPSRTPFDIAELVNCCVGHVAESSRSWRKDLIACALVARSWVDAAQSRLLRAPHETNCIARRPERPWINLLRTLSSYPHLIRHVRELEIKCIGVFSLSTFESICNFSFTHLESVTICNSGMTTQWFSEPHALPLQQLFSAPTLRYISFEADIYDLSAFAVIWQRCSPSIRHLDLAATFLESPDPPSAIPHCVSPIRLTSLRVDFLAGGHYNQEDLYSTALYRFDVSHLKALSIHADGRIPWSKFDTEAIERLDADVVITEDDAIDLSMFPNLSFFRIRSFYDKSNKKLFPITSSQRIGTIIVNLGDFDDFYLLGSEEECGFGLSPGTQCRQLDSILSSLPTPDIQFEVGAPGFREEAWQKMFPKLTSAGKLRFVDSRADGVWWKEFVSPL